MFLLFAAKIDVFFIPPNNCASFFKSYWGRHIVSAAPISLYVSEGISTDPLPPPRLPRCPCGESHPLQEHPRYRQP